VGYCGRDFSQSEIKQIRRIIAEEPPKMRVEISRAVCRAFKWYKRDGGLKDMSCRVALLRMEKDGLIKLPPPKRPNVNGKNRIRFTSDTKPQSQILLSAGELPDLRIELVCSLRESRLWNEYVHRYHYLGYKPLPGAQLRYFIYSQNNILALLGFGASAWKVAPRDKFIGWSIKQRTSNIHLIINNARFLILPWIKSKNLASKILSLVSKRIQNDWQRKYGYQPVLLETFVECERFQGTCYKAANWTKVGVTKGRGKLDVKHEHALPVKDIFLYPVNKKFRQVLVS
jgi:hypothetical protein